MTDVAVLLYDDACGLCRRALRIVLAWDRAGRIRPVALQSPEAPALLPALSQDQRMASWHLVTDGRVFSGGAAVEPLARILPLGAPVALIAATFPRTTDRAYRWVAANRGRLAKLLSKERA